MATGADQVKIPARAVAAKAKTVAATAIPMNKLRIVFIFSRCRFGYYAVI
jgi:hypothetical protein